MMIGSQEGRNEGGSSVEFEEILKNIGDSIIAANSEGKVTRINPTAELFTGWSQEEALGRSIGEVIHLMNEGTGAEIEVSTEGISHGELVIGPADQTVLIASDGTMHPLSGAIRAMRTEEGHLLGIVAILREISEYKQVERALMESGELFQAVIEQAADIILMLEIYPGAIPIILDASRSTFEVLGYERDELIGQPVSIIDADVFDEKRMKERERAGRSEKPIVFEVRHRCKDGTIRHFECMARWLRRSGRILGVSVERDITDRRRTEEALRRNERYYRSLLENAPDIISVFSREAIFLYQSPSIREVAGWQPEEWVGHSAFEFVHPEDQAMAGSILEKMLAGPGMLASGVRYRVRCKDGGYKTFDGMARNLLDDPAVGGIVVNARDITDQLRREKERAILEDQLRQAQRMESIGRLTGGVAHDFNNLLTAILGSAEYLQASLDPMDPLSQDVREILKATDSATGLIKQLLAFSRKQIIQPRVIELNRTVERLHGMLARLIGEDIDLAFALEPNLWQINADPSQIDQILLNLAVNSRDAMANGGKLTIETANVVFDEEYCADHLGTVAGEFVMLAVSDNGVGMTKEVLDNIFEPFFSTKAMERGTGLGLATVYGVVKQHGGFIYPYSEPGKGTTIKVYLPRAIGLGERPVAEDTIRPNGGIETVLLVEDQDMVRRLAKRIMEREGYRVLEARDGKEAMVKSKKHQGEIHLLFTDVVMPFLSGKELYWGLLRERPGIKVLYMSGYTENTIAHRGVLEPQTVFLNKPFKTKELLQKVREALDAS